MSRCLAERGIEHAVLERGTVANSWRTERWDSLRLLTPNWQSRLPGFSYQGDDPNGFRTMRETIAYIDTYARVIDAPVQTQTRVTSVRPDDAGYLLKTDRGEWRCRAAVIASGACNLASVPDCARDLPIHVRSLTPMRYRRPGDIEPGGVLVVGASATGIQLAQEIHRSGRPVTLCVGEHIRMPRLYRGMDIQWWMDRIGVLDERYDRIDDIVRARNVPSMQLVGTPERATLDLNALTAMGVRLVGRLAAIRDGKALFSGSLRNVCALSDLKMNRLLDVIDVWARDRGLDNAFEAPVRPPPTKVEDAPLLTLDFDKTGIKTVLWATGYSPDLSWMHAPVFDRKGRIRHEGGITELPGLYVMGMQFLRRRKSALIDGAADDARELSAHLAGYLKGSR